MFFQQNVVILKKTQKDRPPVRSNFGHEKMPGAGIELVKDFQCSVKKTSGGRFLGAVEAISGMKKCPEPESNQLRIFSAPSKKTSGGRFLGAAEAI